MTGMGRLVTRWASLLLAVMGAAAAAQAQQAASTGRVEGVVFDSVAMRPLAKAHVQLFRNEDPAATRTGTTDRDGRFRFDSVAAGPWIIGALHSRLDSLGIKQFARRIDVKARGRTRIALAIPDARTLITSMCGRATAHDTLGVVMGTLRRADSSRSPVRGVLRFQWMEIEISATGIDRTVTGFEQATDDAGDFIACGVPMEARVQVQAGAGADSSGVLELTTDGDGIRRLDLFVGPPTRRVVAQVVRDEDSTGVVIDTLRTSYLTGPGRIDGTVTLDARGLPNVRVALWGSGMETITSDSGRYTLRGLPLGTHTIETRAIGYEPMRALFDVLPDGIGTHRVSLTRVTRLDTVRIRAMNGAVNRYFNRDEFEARRKRGTGTFVTPEELVRMNPMLLSQLFITAPAVSTQWASGGGERLLMGFGQGACAPTLWVDGREMDAEQFAFFVRPSDVAAVEVYRRQYTTPPQFISNRNLGGAGCGSIVIWTGVRPRPQ